MTRLAALCLIALPAAAQAWGAPGHELVGAIAESRLSPAAHRLVQSLIGDGHLSDPDIATWADTHRDHATAPWHYVNIPLAASYDAARDCRSSCVVSALEQAIADLRSQAGGPRRLAALRWVVHLVADIHQPLHAGDGWDRGGNDLRVRLGHRQEPTNFHHVWDTEVVRPLLAHGGVPAAAARLNATISSGDVAAWTASLDPGAWAQESHVVAQGIYAALGRVPTDRSIVALPAAYPEDASRRAALALSRAAVRLAAVLNQVAAEDDAYLMNPRRPGAPRGTPEALP